MLFEYVSTETTWFSFRFVLSFLFRRSGVSGKLLVNGEDRDESTFRKQSCYIMQNDNLQPLLTVHEAMTVAANLKLSARNTHREKQSRVIFWV